ncbi:trigger factor [Butyrivibrio proteoclasticus]|uniref:trigger factor n=1 Tax=Butyrivibrio proteoclasticus TaxID=43305 RepID=UPI00047C32AB|nr:trigger factor [Butyrivibrio proteoclasticus]
MKKKLFLVLMSAVACASMTGCSLKSPLDSNTNESAATASASTETVSGLTIDFANLETMTLSEITASDYVTLGEYKGITIELAQPVVTDEQVESEFQNLLSYNAPTQDVTGRPVQEGDTVIIDYVGKYADTQEAFEGGTATGASLTIGSGSYIDGFESGLVGVNAGETVDLNLTFPADYQATDLAGKDVIFTVTVQSITESCDPTDEWAASFGIEGVTTIDGLKDYLRNSLTEDAESNYRSQLETMVVDTVTANAIFTPVPEKLLNRYLVEQNDSLEYYASMWSQYQGTPISTSDIVYQMMNNEGYTGTPDDYLKSATTEIVNQYVLFQAIADAEGIVVTDEDVDAYLKESYDNAGTTAYSSFEEFSATITDREMYKEGLMAQKVMDFLVENANVVEPATEG